jgi:hypothetical protein
LHDRDDSHSRTRAQSISRILMRFYQYVATIEINFFFYNSFLAEIFKLQQRHPMVKNGPPDVPSWSFRTSVFDIGCSKNPLKIFTNIRFFLWSFRPSVFFLLQTSDIFILKVMIFWRKTVVRNDLRHRMFGMKSSDETSKCPKMRVTKSALLHCIFRHFSTIRFLMKFSGYIPP